MMVLYNPSAVERIEEVYPAAAKGLLALITAAEDTEAGSAELVLRYDKSEDKKLGKYEVMLVMRVQERADS